MPIKSKLFYGAVYLAALAVLLLDLMVWRPN